jgi:peptidoglycan hydrolase-like protein with peptidoglycan-binding domain
MFQQVRRDEAMNGEPRTGRVACILFVAMSLALLSGCPKTQGTPPPLSPAAQAPAPPEPIAPTPTLASPPPMQPALPAPPQVSFPAPSPMPDPAIAPPAQVSAPAPPPRPVEPFLAPQPPPQAAAETLLDPALPPDAEMIQARLAELGLYKGAIDGKWGSRSRAALKSFKTKNGLPDPEAWDRETQAALFRGGEPGRPMAVGTRVKEVSAGFTVLDPTVDRDAELIQARLAELGLYKGAIDGKWGARSRAALQSFRQKNGLGASYSWDKETQDRLFGK